MRARSHQRARGRGRRPGEYVNRRVMCCCRARGVRCCAYVVLYFFVGCGVAVVGRVVLDAIGGSGG
eukprot:4540342-Prymnesium_polylepis.2